MITQMPPGAVDAALPTQRRGHGPVVVLVHGVGVDARSFDAVADRLAGHRTVVVVDRPGYGAAADRPVAAADDQVAALRATVAAEEGPVLLAGVSGGATLALAVALDPPANLAGAVVHEPLVGPLAAELHDLVVEARERLADQPTPEVARAFLADLARGAQDGTWPHPPPAAALVAAEVDLFTRLQPTVEDLRARPALPLLTSLDRGAPPARQAAAQVLATHAMAEVVALTGVGHLPQLQAPTTFADLLAGR